MSVIHEQRVTQPQAANTSTRLRQGKLLFLGAAFLSFLVSVALWFAGSREEGLFVGLWVPSILSLGSLILAGRRE